MMVVSELSIYSFNFLLLSTIIFSWLVAYFLIPFLKPNAAAKLPPGPTPIPIVGNLFQLGPKPHQRLAELAATHGPLMTLHLGSTISVVISTSVAVRDVFSSNDVALSNRGTYDANTALDHDKLSIIWLPDSPRWRFLRRIANTHISSSASLNASRHHREKIVNDLLSLVQNHSDLGLAVDIGEAAFNAILNLMWNTTFSVDTSTTTCREFKQLFWDLTQTISKPNISDFFPLLRPFDLQGIRRRMALNFQKCIDLIDAMINDRLSGKTGVQPESEEDILGILLKLSREDNSNMPRSLIIHTIMDLFVAGTDTSSSTIQFAMAELIRNPEKMKKLCEELTEVVGRGKSIQELDVAMMPYLKAVMKETLRLHPATPFTSRKSPLKDIEARGYVIPKGTRVWVNLWAIGRDPMVWKNPLSFEPERHIKSESDFRSSNFELIPFGLGRRICPGLSLVMRIVPLVLASLVHSFDWKLEDKGEPKSLDMEEAFGLALVKAIPLRVVPFKVN